MIGTTNSESQKPMIDEGLRNIPIFHCTSFTIKRQKNWIYPLQWVGKLCVSSFFQPTVCGVSLISNLLFHQIPRKFEEGRQNIGFMNFSYLKYSKSDSGLFAKSVRWGGAYPLVPFRTTHLSCVTTSIWWLVSFLTSELFLNKEFLRRVHR